MRRSPRSCARSRSVHRLCSKPLLAEPAQYHRQAAGVVEILHQELARRASNRPGSRTPRPSRSKSSSESSTPTRRAIASKCTYGIRGAANCSQACGSRSRTICAPRSSIAPRSSWTISTIRRPAMRASSLRRASTAGIAAFSGRPTPSASTMRGHSRGGAHRHAVAGAERFIAGLGLMEFVERDLAGAQLLAHRDDAGARADDLPAIHAAQLRPRRRRRSSAGRPRRRP